METRAASSSPGAPRGLRGLLAFQFLGTFNDHAWKTIVITLALRSAVSGAGPGGEFAQACQLRTTAALLAFALPMLLLSLPGGLLADRLNKRSVIVTMKAVEILLLAVAAFCLLLWPKGLAPPFAVLALLGAASALLSPSKYGVLPEILPRERLVWGNGLLQVASMAAAIAGTGLGPALLLADRGGLRPELTCVAPLFLAALALAGLPGALGIPGSRRAARGRSLGGTAGAAWHALRADPGLARAALGTGVAMALLSLVGQSAYVQGREVTRADPSGELLSGLPPAVLAAGVAAGALLAARLGRQGTGTGAIPPGAFLFSTGALALGFLPPALGGTVGGAALAGAGAGLAVVPLNAILQARSPADRRGGVLALASLFQLAGMIAGSASAQWLSRSGLATGDVALLAAIPSVAALAWTLWLLPALPLRIGRFVAGWAVARGGGPWRSGARGKAGAAPRHAPQEGIS